MNVVESHNHVLFSVDEVRGSFPDPRFPPLGRRLYGDETEAKDTGMYHERRMECGVAEGCEELGELLPFHVGTHLEFFFKFFAKEWSKRRGN